MAKKRKQSQAARRGAGPSKNHGVAWFLAGAITGSLVTWVAVGRDPAAEQVRAAVGRTTGQPIGVDSATRPPKPKFEFYTLLPEMEVVVPEEDLATPPPRPAKAAPETKDASADEAAPATKQASTMEAAPEGKEAPADDSNATRGPYIVQIASFKSLKDADSLKVKLILNGFNPVVQSVVISGEEKRYRVRLGPYPDRDSLEAARVRLRASGYDNPLVVRVRRG